MVSTSYCPPLVAMSVVTRSRRMFSSSVTHSSWMFGFASVKGAVICCMRIMSPLFTVAIVRVTLSCAAAMLPTAHRAVAPRRARNVVVM